MFGHCVGIKYFHHYLYGQKFTIITDHAVLVYLKNIVNPVGKSERWLMALNGFNFEIINLSNHSNIDFLSRIYNFDKSNLIKFIPIRYINLRTLLLEFADF